MANHIKYNPEYNQLSPKENDLLAIALKSVERFVKKSPEISHTNYATRNAHAKSYAYLNGKFIPDKSDELSELFNSDQYKTTIRLSHANLKIASNDNQLPLFGFALKIILDDNVHINYPLVNFPVFITNSVSKFLKIFILTNQFFTTSLLAKSFKIIPLFINVVKIVPEILNRSFFKSITNWVKNYSHFILARDYYSIGVYRLGDYMVKIKLVPKNVNYNYKISHSIFENVKSYLEKNELIYDLFYEISENEKNQPINKLTTIWKKTQFNKLGTLLIENIIEDQDNKLEKLSFSPFDSPEEFQPVGRIQFLRKYVYMKSSETRNLLNSIKE